MRPLLALLALLALLSSACSVQTLEVCTLDPVTLECQDSDALDDSDSRDLAALLASLTAQEAP